MIHQAKQLSDLYLMNVTIIQTAPITPPQPKTPKYQALAQSSPSSNLVGTINNLTPMKGGAVKKTISPTTANGATASLLIPTATIATGVTTASSLGSTKSELSRFQETEDDEDSFSNTFEAVDFDSVKLRRNSSSSLSLTSSSQSGTPSLSRRSSIGSFISEDDKTPTITTDDDKYESELEVKSFDINKALQQLGKLDQKSDWEVDSVDTNQSGGKSSIASEQTTDEDWSDIDFPNDPTLLIKKINLITSGKDPRFDEDFSGLELPNEGKLLLKPRTPIPNVKETPVDEWDDVDTAAIATKLKL
jgi:hypothetical protein